jgi:hypothetical protein
MPLTRAKPEFLINPHGVEFLMRDGEREVVCSADSEVLRYCFGSEDDAGYSDVFRLNRDAIEQAASEKYDTSAAVPPAYDRVTLTVADMASPLSRKM